MSIWRNTLKYSSLIESRYLISVEPVAVPDDDAAEGGTNHPTTSGRDDRDRDDRGGGPSRKKKSKEEKKARQGQNKNRKFGKVRDDFDLCFKVASGSVCDFGPE